MNKIIWWIVIVLVIGLGVWAIYNNRTQPVPTGDNTNVQNTQTGMPPAQAPAVLQISSPAFANNGDIPEQYTCDGNSASIPLNFSGVPSDAKSLALIMDDPDVPTTSVPSGLFVHWVVYNMPATTTKLTENKIPPGTQGNNGIGNPVYIGPCPPDRQHRYFFKLYALDSMLNLPVGATKVQLEASMQGHIVAQAQMIGLYNKKANRP